MTANLHQPFSGKGGLFPLFKSLTVYDCFFSDIDECKKSPIPCHEHAQCRNTDGSYTCTCNLGFDGDGHNSCTGNAYNNNCFRDAPVAGGVGGIAFQPNFHVRRQVHIRQNFEHFKQISLIFDTQKTKEKKMKIHTSVT